MAVFHAHFDVFYFSREGIFRIFIFAREQSEFQKLMNSPIMFRRDLVRRGIKVIEIFQEEKCVPCYHDMKFSRMSLEIKFTAYHEPHLAEVDLLRDILLLRDDILKRNKYEQSSYSFPSKQQ